MFFRSYYTDISITTDTFSRVYSWLRALMLLVFMAVCLNKNECTMDQELYTVEFLAGSSRTLLHMQQRAPGVRCVCTHQVAALFCMKWRHDRHLESVASYQKIREKYKFLRSISSSKIFHGEPLQPQFRDPLDTLVLSHFHPRTRTFCIHYCVTAVASRHYLLQYK